MDSTHTNAQATDESSETDSPLNTITTQQQNHMGFPLVFQEKKCLMHLPLTKNKESDLL